MKILFLLIDALNLIRRIYEAQPANESPEQMKGALATCGRSFQRAISEARPTHAACIFDGDGPSWRHEIFPGYRSGRPPMPSVLREHLDDFRRVFADFGARSFVFPNMEADDVIATLACKVAGRGGSALILSTDKIFLQLLSDRVEIRDHFARKTIDEKIFRETYGIGPDRFPDILALAGDAASSIPGVPSVGLKTAARLVGQCASLDDLLAVAYTIKGRSGEALLKNAEQARLSLRLARLRTDIVLGGNLRDFRLG